MAGRDPLLPNAWIVARREYRDRVRGPLFVASTIVLMGLAMLVAVAPIGIRYLDRQTVTRLAVVSADSDLAIRAVAVADSLLNIPPQGADPAAWEKPYRIERRGSRQVENPFGGERPVQSSTPAQRSIDVVVRTNEGAGSAGANSSTSPPSIASRLGSRLPSGTVDPSSRRPTTSSR
jgi:hypothetical protein